MIFTSLIYKDKLNMNTLVDLFRQSVIIQAIITLIVISTIAFMYISGREVPDGLVNLAFIIVGYYFGSKTQQATDVMIARMSSLRRDR